MLLDNDQGVDTSVITPFIVMLPLQGAVFLVTICAGREQSEQMKTFS